MSSKDNKEGIENIVIVNDFNYTQGGASKVAIDTARILSEHGFNVFFFSAVSKEEEKIKGVTYISTNQQEALKEKNKIKGAVNGIYNFEARKKMQILLKKLDRNNTIIHVHGWTKALSSSVFDVAFRMKFKVVLTLHDYFTACPNGGYFNYKKNEICYLKPLTWKCIKCNCDSRNYGFKLYRIIRQFVQNKVVKLNKRLKNVITISEFSERILRKTLTKNVIVTRVYNPIDINKGEDKVDISKNKYYLYVGRISKEKGVDLFCKVITELGYKGIAVGDGEEKEKLEKVYPNIDFVGWKNKEEVKEYMKNAKALIFTSRWYETAGLTVLEAQALGIPCIVNEKCAAGEFNCTANNYRSYEELKEKLKQNSYQINKIENKYTTDKYYYQLIECYKNI